MEIRQGKGKNSIGNVEAKELICMTHGHELKGGNVGGRGCARQNVIKDGKWDNCISIINKIYLRKSSKGQKTIHQNNSHFLVLIFYDK